MGLIKKTIEGQQKSQTIALIAIGVSVVALFCVFALIGAKNASN